MSDLPKAGAKLQAACGTEVIVVKRSAGPIQLQDGGGALFVGKRYMRDVRCGGSRHQAGELDLVRHDVRMVLAQGKALPSSD